MWERILAQTISRTCTIWIIRKNLQSDQGIIQWLAWEYEEFLSVNLCKYHHSCKIKRDQQISGLYFDSDTKHFRREKP